MVKICFKIRYNCPFNVFLMFFIFLAWLVLPCCGVGVFQTPPYFE
ncbi:putative membrane protein [Helicobacter pylori NQ4053]|uniref:Putative membrane protein n=1 Tax=Helicobacter pylori NQ4053 TaxID=992027 RepID=I9QEM2_HELPX|nr:putative membrane protein [Helicobacter pylori NQ4053]